jgi:hypothetical protein
VSFGAPARLRASPEEVWPVVVVRRLALGLLCLIVRLVQLLVLATYVAMAAVAALVLGVIGVVMLAFMAAEEKCGGTAPTQRCFGGGAAPATFRAADMR